VYVTFVEPVPVRPNKLNASVALIVSNGLISTVSPFLIVSSEGVTLISPLPTSTGTDELSTSRLPSCPLLFRPYVHIYPVD